MTRFVSRKPSADNTEAAVPVIGATPAPNQPTELNIFSEPFGAEIDLDGCLHWKHPFPSHRSLGSASDLAASGRLWSMEKDDFCSR
jgi:hypothetical protein